MSDNMEMKVAARRLRDIKKTQPIDDILSKIEDLKAAYQVGVMDISEKYHVPIPIETFDRITAWRQGVMTGYEIMNKRGKK